MLLAVALCIAVPAAAAEPTPSSDPSTANQAGPQAGNSAGDGSKLLDLDVEQLAQTPVVAHSTTPLAMDEPVTSVTKEQSTLAHSAAAVFVITNEMIHRSGATCIPEALRMAPGLEVARVNTDTWAITARGFNSVYANQLLVLIDGRCVYNPDFSGVFWNMQDVLLEDVERIEVIRGPGGTLYGANAVNGVINIITKQAKDTQGAYASAGGGTYDRSMAAVRYGGHTGDCYWRVYGKYFDRGPGADPQPPGSDEWHQQRVGFRADWDPGLEKKDLFTFQGDHFDGATANGVVLTDPTIGELQLGEDLLARWRHVYDEDRDWSLQTYYDRISRMSSVQAETVKTCDIDFQYRFPLGSRQSITCGAGYRNVDSYLTGGDQFGSYFPSPTFITNYTNQFVQDEITLVPDRWTCTLGCKLEQNPYTGLEYQPTARLLWTLDKQQSLWCAVSRAVRTPSRSEEQVVATLPATFPDVYPRAFGSDTLISEDLIAYEIGYRKQVSERFSYDVATFYNVYDHLIGAIQGSPFVEIDPLPPHLIVPLVEANGGSAETYGVELAANFSLSQRWQIFAQYTFFEMQTQANGLSLTEGDDPVNQVYLRSSWDLGEKWQFDLTGRYVDELAGLNVPSYLSMDLRLAWRPWTDWEVEVVGQNLLQSQHQEFAGGTAAAPGMETEVPRAVYGTVTWRH